MRWIGCNDIISIQCCLLAGSRRSHSIVTGSVDEGRRISREHSTEPADVEVVGSVSSYAACWRQELRSLLPADSEIKHPDHARSHDECALPVCALRASIWRFLVQGRFCKGFHAQCRHFRDGCADRVRMSLVTSHYPELPGPRPPLQRIQPGPQRFSVWWPLPGWRWSLVCTLASRADDLDTVLPVVPLHYVVTSNDSVAE